MTWTARYTKTIKGTKNEHRMRTDKKFGLKKERNLPCRQNDDCYISVAEKTAKQR